MRRTVLFCIILFAVSLSSCKTQYEILLEGGDVDMKYRAAMEYFEKGKYSKAGALLESIKMAVKGTDQGDTVEFYTALSHYRIRDLFTAETSLESFINSYPMSPFIDEARYLYISCLYDETYRYELDQDPTYRAIMAISQYLVESPDSEYRAKCQDMLKDLEERLDRKAYESAKLYYDMNDYKASRYAFKNVLKNDADNIYREQIMYYTVLSSYKFAYNSVKEKQYERYMVFTDDYLNFVSEYPDSKYFTELKALYDKVQKQYK